MSDCESLDRILEEKIVAVIRAADAGPLAQVAEALASGGVSVVEVTLTVPNALEAIATIRRELANKVLVGAGTVLDAQTARAAILAGAEFIVSPTLHLDTIALCRRHGKVVMPGAFTPTEILAAWQAGADIVKIFPAEIGGPAYFSALRGPLPHIRLMPSGGVNLDTATAFLRAGACCLGVGSNLVDPKAIAARDFARITELAGTYSRLVREFDKAP